MQTASATASCGSIATTDGAVNGSPAIAGMTIDSPFGIGGKLTMRAEDNTLVNYATGWGQTIQKDPYVPDVQAVDWKVITELETEWKKKMKYI